MLISCKCVNFIATFPQLQRSSSICGNGTTTGGAANGSVASTLSLVFRQKYPRNFMFYTQFIDFFRHAYGPIPDLTINAISQRDLIYNLTLDTASQSWQLSFCMNCREVLCAKSLSISTGNPQQQSSSYLLNCTLLTNSEELAQRRANKSFSETFELLIMDHTQLGGGGGGGVGGATASGNDAIASSLNIGSLSTNPLTPVDGKQQRLRQLQAHQQARLQREISETNERIDRYTEQQFALLKSFREKCDQECAMLVHLILQVPDQAAELLDRAAPTTLEVTGSAIAFNTVPSAAVTSRRRNTISSRRDLLGGGGMISGPTTPTTTVPPPLINFLSQQQPQQQQPPPQQQLLPSVALITSRKMSSFDTPPATPEATPMSVGNSPTFRQQATPTYVNGILSPMSTTTTTSSGGGVDDADDCLFDLEDVEAPPQPQQMPILSFGNRNNAYGGHHHHHQHQTHKPEVSHSHNNHMAGVDEGDATAEEAEDALDLDTSMPIPMRKFGARSTAHMMNFAKSLPIEIANSPLAERAAADAAAAAAAAGASNNFVVEDEEVLDNTVDIAASIKALAKSVHGEAVFGDLPRPRLRSQI